MKPLVIRADASSQIGTGHVMRMIALGQAWQRRGGRAIIATSLCPPALVERIQEEGLTHRSVPGDRPGDDTDADATIALASNWLVLDGYHFQSDYQIRCRKAGLKILCVDDYGHCPHWECDLVLNQNPGARPYRQNDLSSLTGVSYALLRQEFLSTSRPLTSWGPVTRLLVTLGGSDPRNDTLRVLRHLEKIHRNELEVRAIIGPSNPHAAELKSFNLSYEVDWRERISDMPAEYRWADGIISAGGSSCWEWLSFGLPGVVATIADNQEAVVAELARQKIALCPGWPAQWTDLSPLQQWLHQPARLIDRQKATTLVDARGADRVAATIDGSRCLLRALDPERDETFTFELANHPSVRAAGYARDEISPDEHRAWLARHHESINSHLFVIEATDTGAVGFLRFHRRDSGWEIGIALVPEARGRGFADHAVRLGMTELETLHDIRRFLAHIRPENRASKNLFQGLGFSLDAEEKDREIWTRTRS